MALRRCPFVPIKEVSPASEAVEEVVQVVDPLLSAPDGIASLQRSVYGCDTAEPEELSVRFRATKWFLKGTMTLHLRVEGQ
tara:strand:- start:31 stop:273 length:243 start_codon:yes stop_codon:yes gene_type:complete